MNPTPSWRISRSVLQNLLHASRHVYPNEFIALLGVLPEDPFHIHEFVIVPAEFGLEHSQLRVDLIPNDPLIVGTVHSHPSRSARASDADLDAFARLGKIHLILRYPYDDSSFRAYAQNGKSIVISVVPDESSRSGLKTRNE